MMYIIVLQAFSLMYTMVCLTLNNLPKAQKQKHKLPIILLFQQFHNFIIYLSSSTFVYQHNILPSYVLKVCICTITLNKVNYIIFAREELLHPNDFQWKTQTVDEQNCYLRFLIRSIFTIHILMYDHIQPFIGVYSPLSFSYLSCHILLIFDFYFISFPFQIKALLIHSIRKHNHIGNIVSFIVWMGWLYAVPYNILSFSFVSIQEYLSCMGIEALPFSKKTT